MRVLALYGSPRKTGNTLSLLEAAVEGARAEGADVEVVDLNRRRIIGCQECESCYTTGECRYLDDMEPLYRSFELMDALILASPIFFAGLSAQVKLVVDRCQAFWGRKYKVKGRVAADGSVRPGLFIGVAGRENSDGQLFAPALATARLFFQAVDARLKYEVLCDDTDRSPVSERPGLRSQAGEMGRALVRDRRNQTLTTP